MSVERVQANVIDKVYNPVMLDISGLNISRENKNFLSQTALPVLDYNGNNYEQCWTIYSVKLEHIKGSEDI